MIPRASYERILEAQTTLRALGRLPSMWWLTRGNDGFWAVYDDTATLQGQGMDVAEALLMAGLMGDD